MAAFRQTPIGQLLRAPFVPRLLMWMPVAALLPAGLQWAFAHVPAIPHYLCFNPGVVVIPLAGLFLGPAGAWAAVAGTLAGDWASGFWGPLTPWRAGGAMAWAFTTQQLWDLSWLPGCCGPEHRARPGQTIRFIMAAIPGALVAAAWPALGSDVHHLYAYPYYFGILAVHNMVFTLLPGLALYRILAREIAPGPAGWRKAMGIRDHEALVSLPRGLILFATAAGAPVAGVIIGAAAGGWRPFVPGVIGTSCGPSLVWPLAALLALHGLALLWPSRPGRI